MIRSSGARCLGPIHAAASNDPAASMAVVGVAAVDRAFKILAAFETSNGTLPLSEIAQRTGLYKSTILRITTSMERAGFLVRLPDRRFAVGPELRRLALLYERSHFLRWLQVTRP